MKNKFAVAVIAALVLAVVAFLITGEVPTDKVEIPPAPAQNIYVADYAAMLDDSTKEKILATGKALHAKHKAQVVVVTIPTLGDWSIDDYANKLFRSWGIGDKNLNNGVLLLIVKDDRKFRIEVGYGLEGAITDGYSGSVLDSMKSYFREGNYSAGTLQAYNTLTKKIYEEYGDEIPENIKAAPENTGSEDFTTGEIVVLVIFILLIIISIFRSGGGGFFPFWIDTGSSNRSFGGSSSNDDDDFGGGSSGGGGASDDW